MSLSYRTLENKINLNTGSYDIDSGLGNNGDILELNTSTGQLTLGPNGGGTGADFLVATDNLFIPNTLSAGGGAIQKNVVISPYPATYSLSAGQANTYVGYDCGSATTSSYNNVGVGSYALKSMQSGSGNVGIGEGALYNASDCADNVAIGSYALRDSIGWWNVGIGKYSLADNTNGEDNVGIGIYALQNNLTGNYNVAVGNYALENGTIGIGSTAVGYDAGLTSSGNYNVFMGYQAGEDCNASSNCVVIGADSVIPNSSSNRIALGYQANTTVDNSCQIGNSSVNLLKLGSKNVVDFSRAASSTLIGCSTSTTNPMTGDANLIINLIHNTNFNRYGISNNNTYLGNSCGRGQSATNHTGSSNTAVGSSALNNVTSCVSCSAFGTSSLTNLVGGSYNIGIGANSGASNSNGTGDIYIGVTAASSPSVLNEVVIAGGTATTTGAGNNTITLGNGSCTAIVPSVGVVSLGASARPFSNLWLENAGTAAICGVATLVAGTKAISTTAVDSNSIIMVTYKTFTSTIASNTSVPEASYTSSGVFTINAYYNAGGGTKTLDTTNTSVVHWMLIQPTS